uniref:RNA helicase n=1 Tax=Ananas comosus var. bracteatus TaxID=296719 RepID=A0A6V7P0S3_ANACO|nr:unnamed protein product [Ananas comosus var. bracteatus]
MAMAMAVASSATPPTHVLLLTPFSSSSSLCPNPRLRRRALSTISRGVRVDEEGGRCRARTLREVCDGRVPDHVLKRAEEIGYVMPTDVQEQALPILLSGRDCVLHAQTGSGKTLAYLLLIFSALDFRRSAVQALIVVPTRELGMQVAKVARMLAAKPAGMEEMQRACTVMALLDGGMLKRQKSWLKAEPPEIVVATIGSLCQMLEKHLLKLEAMRVLVIDEADFIFSSSKQGYSLRKLLTAYSTIESRQTVFASASIPQHNHFLYDCAQQKWTKNDVVHVHVNPVEPMPSHLHHKYVICSKKERLHSLLCLLERDAPKSGIIFVADQSEKSKRAGELPSTTLVIEFLKASYSGLLEVLLLEEDMNFNARATSFSEMRQQQGCLLVSTDIASEGLTYRKPLTYTTSISQKCRRLPPPRRTDGASAILQGSVQRHDSHCSGGAVRAPKV